MVEQRQAYVRLPHFVFIDKLIEKIGNLRYIAERIVCVRHQLRVRATVHIDHRQATRECIMTAFERASCRLAVM